MTVWPIRSLGELCTVIAGGTPLRSRPEYFGGGIPWVKIGDMTQGIVESTEETISEEGLANSSAKLLPAGTVLVSIFATIGRTATLGMQAATNQAIAGVAPNEPGKLLPAFLRRFLDHSVNVLVRQADGVAQLNINGKILKSLPVPVPPLGEQERIVAILDAAEELRRLREQADRRTADLIPALFHEMFGAPRQEDFPVKKLHEVAEVVSGIAKGRKFNGRQTIHAPYLRVANVQSGYLNLAEIKYIEALPEEVKALALKYGDILLTEGGDFDKLGRGAMWEATVPNCIHQNHIFRVRTDSAVLNPVFFSKYLLTSSARMYFLRCAKKTTNLASINMTQLRGLPVTLPPLPLQRDFATRVGGIRAMEADQAASRHRLENLFQSLLHRAFKGEL